MREVEMGFTQMEQGGVLTHAEAGARLEKKAGAIQSTRYLALTDHALRLVAELWAGASQQGASNFAGARTRY